MTLKLRLACGVATGLCVGVPIAWTLASPGAADHLETPFIRSLVAPAAVPFPTVTPWEADRIHQMSLYSALPGEVLRHSQLQIMFSQNDMASRHPATGRLEVIGTECVFEMVAQAEINNGRAQSFNRKGRCLPSQGRATGELFLTIKMGGPGELGIYTQVVDADEPNAHIFVTEAASRSAGWGRRAAVIGSFVDDVPARGLVRSNLLAYVWTTSTDATRIWLWLGLSVILIAAGASIFPFHAAGHGRPIVFAATAAAGAFCLATGFSLIYALTIVPLQSADEPNYVLTYGEITQQPAFAQQTDQWIRTSYLERIRGRGDFVFRPRDIGIPYSEAGKFAALPLLTRSSLSASAWSTISRVLGPQSVAQAVGSVRVIHAVIFGFCVAFGTGLLVILCPVPYPQLLGLAALVIPAVASFGMQFTEAALLTSVSVMFATCVIVLLVDGPHTAYLGLPLGLTTAGILLATRSGAPMLVMAAMMLGARALMGSRETARPLVSATIFWAGVGIGLSMFHILVSASHLERLADILGQIGSRAPLPVQPVLSSIAQPWFAVAAAVGGWLLEVGLHRPRLVLTELLSHDAVTRAIRFAAVLVAAAILASLVGSLRWKYPDVATIESPLRPSLGDYVGQVLATMATVFRVTDHSMWMSTSFWLGFGWLDTIPTPPFGSVLIVLTAAATIGLVHHTAIRGTSRQFVLLVMIAAALVITLAAYAVSAYQILTNLHGRYLIPWYLVAVMVAWSFPAVAWPHASEARGERGSRVALVLGLAVFVHTFCACFILRRYF